MSFSRRWTGGAALVVAVGCLSAGVSAQTTTMPSTLRYGSGLMDVPVSSVLPHMAITGTVSGFFVSLDRRAVVDASGDPLPPTTGLDEFFADASVALGLFDRVEAGLSLQSVGGSDVGGNVWGLFGRVRLFEPVDQGIGLGLGARYVRSPSYGDGTDYEPGRLGFPDRRLRDSYPGRGAVGTTMSAYGVATAFLRGFDGGPLPPNDVTFTLGYGGGMFGSGSQLGFYGESAGGWFGGAGVHLEVGDRSLLTLMAEFNGFDVNVGTQVDLAGVRVGVQYLATNHAAPVGGHVSEYQKPKLGVLGSLAVCPDRPGFRCRPRRMHRAEPDTIWIPPPPPDTVIVSGEAPPETGSASTLCLSTGQSVEVRITELGDTLVGPSRTPVRALRPVMDFAGSYASGAFWFESGQDLEFEGSVFRKSTDSFPIDCSQILRVGVHEGVAVFADRAAERPLGVLFVPVEVGRWHRYERQR